MVFGAVGLAVLAGLILAAGWAMDTFGRAGDSVATVYGTPITTRQVADEALATVPSMEAQLRQQYSGPRQALLTQQLEQQKRGLPDQALNQLVQRRILEHEAAARGISVTPADVETRIQQNVAEYQALSAPTPEPAPTDPAATAEPSPTQPAGVTPTPLATLDPASFQTALKQQLDQFNLTENRYRQLVALQVLQTRLQDAMGAEVPPVQEQVRARHLLLTTEQQARDALARVQAGEDFAVLARELSTDPGSKDKGGDLGWFPRGVMNKPFEDAAFALQPGQISDVVQSPNGFHIIEVVERDPARPLEPGLLEVLQQRKFSDWLNVQSTSDAVQRDFSTSERDWVLRQLRVRP